MADSKKSATQTRTTYHNSTNTERKKMEQQTEPNGIVLYTEDGDPVRVVLMDERDEHLSLVANPEDGVYGYENRENTVTMFLEEP